MSYFNPLNDGSTTPWSSDLATSLGVADPRVFVSYHNETGGPKEHGQNNDLQVGTILHGHPIQIHVHHDGSYPFQSKGYAEVWNPATLTWNRIASLLPWEIDTCHHGAEALIARAAGLLGGTE